MAAVKLNWRGHLGVSAEPPGSERAEQLRAAYAALQSQIPLLYAVALANVVGLHVAAGGKLTSVFSPVTPLVLLILWRLKHWLSNRDRDLSEATIARELKMTCVYAAVVAGGFSVWAQNLLTSFPEATQSIVFFSVLAAIGCAYALSSHLLAANAPLFLLALPIAVRLLLSDDAVQVGIGTSVFLLIALTWRLLRVQNRTVRDLVSSRLGLSEESQRAQAAEQEAHRLAGTDVLTEAANRRALLAAIEDAEIEQPPVVLALIDLDGFKPINDAFGHRTGDEVLKSVAGRLEVRFGTEACVARMGGDEFALFWRGRAPPELSAIGAEICELIGSAMVIEQRPLRVFACCGLVRRDPGQWTTTDLVSQADIALYAAKARGKGKHVAFSKSLLKQQNRRAAVERALASRSWQTEMQVVFQPICDVVSGKAVAFEALARWTNEELGLIEPGEFIPIAEQMDTIGTITDKTLELALRAAVDWPRELLLSFNVSSLQLCELGAADRLVAAIKQAGFDPCRLQVEVTETAILADFHLARENMSALRAAGAQIALDDFGAGNASISYLREMSFDAVKLDGSLVTSLTTSAQSRKLLKGVIELCRSLGVKCAAEHVETAGQLHILRELGCDLVQGFFVGRPGDTAFFNSDFNTSATKQAA